MKSQAHNFKGYDRYFILEELYKQHVTNLQQIVNVAKILFGIAQCQVHRLHEFFSHGFVKLSKNIWD